MAFVGGPLTLREGESARYWSAGSGDLVACLAGPPASALLFRHVARRLVDGGRSVVLPELFDRAEGPSTVDGIARRIAPVVPEGAVVVSHGLALPVALAVAEARRAARLVLVSGPVERFDPVTRVASAVARRLPWALKALLRPEIAVPALASSAALRRTVQNPYALDRDIVVLLSAPLLATSERRAAVVDYLADIGRMSAPWRCPPIPVHLLWPASDLLYPLPTGASRCLSGVPVDVKIWKGARFFSIEERPWEVAEAILAASGDASTGSTATEMSRFPRGSSEPSSRVSRSAAK